MSQYKNAVVDKNLNASWNAPTPAAGVTALTKAQSIIVRDAPWIPFIAADSLVPVEQAVDWVATVNVLVLGIVGR